MTRIELGHVPAKVQQCERCGKVRGADNVWRHAPAVIPDVVVTCKSCLDWQQRIGRAKRARLDREVRERARQGYGPAPEGVDVFKGLRGE